MIVKIIRLDLQIDLAFIWRINSMHWRQQRMNKYTHDIFRYTPDIP